MRRSSHCAPRGDGTGRDGTGRTQNGRHGDTRGSPPHCTMTPQASKKKKKGNPPHRGRDGLIGGNHSRVRVLFPRLREGGKRERLEKEAVRPRRDSNPQSSDPKSDALSIRPRGHGRAAPARPARSFPAAPGRVSAGRGAALGPAEGTPEGGVSVHRHGHGGRQAGASVSAWCLLGVRSVSRHLAGATWICTSIHLPRL